jgi:hypothetical protein
VNKVAVATNLPQKAPARRPKAKLPPTRHLTALNESDGNESNERKEAGGAPDNIIDYENNDEEDDKVEESMNGESDDEDATKFVSLCWEMEALECPNQTAKGQVTTNTPPDCVKQVRRQ